MVFGPFETNVLCVGRPYHDRPRISRFRVGAEILVPSLQVGGYLNLGELLDFLVGWFGFDPAVDLGELRGTPL